MSAYSKYTDEDLVKLIHADNTTLFPEAYNRYWKQLLALGYYYTHSKPAAEDIVLEVFASCGQQQYLQKKERRKRW